MGVEEADLVPSQKMKSESLSRRGQLWGTGFEHKGPLLTTFSFIVFATCANTATASSLLLRLTKTALDRVMNCPNKGVHCSSFFAMILAPLGNILPRSARNRKPRISSRSHCIAENTTGFPSRSPTKSSSHSKNERLTQDVNHSLMIPNDNSRFGLEMLLSLDCESHPNERRDGPVKAPRDDPIDVLALPYETERNRDDDSPGGG